MPVHIQEPTIIPSVGTQPKIIREYIGRVNSETSELSIAHMSSPKGWLEPGQRPEFDEYTTVLKGELHVETESGEVLILRSGQAIICKSGEWIRYSTPSEDTEYIAVCTPAFHPDTVHRDKA